MKGSIFTAFFLVTLVGLIAQQGEPYLKLPSKFEQPGLKASLSPDPMVTPDPWRVYLDRDGVPVYATRYMREVIDTAYFMETYVAWQESDKALRLVGKTDSGIFMDDEWFGEGCYEKGWVDKEMLVLWPRALSEEGVFYRAIVNKTVNASLYDDGRHGWPVTVPEDGVQIFYVMKVTQNDYLLSRMDLINEGWGKFDQFWIDSRDAEIILDNRGMVPRWDFITENNPGHLFNDPNFALDYVEEYAVDTIIDNNPYIGLLKINEERHLLYSGKSILDLDGSTLYINNQKKRFDEAYLVDYSQFLIFKKVVSIFRNSSMKEELEEWLRQMFMENGLKEEDIQEHTLRELVERISHTRLSNIKVEEVKSFEEMSESDFRTYSFTYGRLYENFDSERKLSRYVMRSDINYYWLPEEWIRSDFLAEISFETKKVDVINTRKTYSSFDFIYIDNSYGNEGKSIEKLEAEITRCNATVFRIENRTEKDATIGHKLFYSDAITPIMGTEMATFNEIVLAMRAGKASVPFRSYDKQVIEEELLLRDIEVVMGDLRFHYFVSRQIIDEEIEERPLLFYELPHRLKALAASDARVSVYLYLFRDELEEPYAKRLAEFADKANQESGSITYYITEYR